LIGERKRTNRMLRVTLFFGGALVAGFILALLLSS
jgi:hypothetical protein